LIEQCWAHSGEARPHISDIAGRLVINRDLWIDGTGPASFEEYRQRVVPVMPPALAGRTEPRSPCLSLRRARYGPRNEKQAQVVVFLLENQQQFHCSSRHKYIAIFLADSDFRCERDEAFKKDMME
jgi:hypothetical protein